jgi:TPR repeat protein
MEQSDKMNRITNASLLQQKQEEFLLLQKQAQEGNVMAQYNVGICYLYGQNTKVDYDKAFSWFEKAAQQGDKLAGLFMGYFYEIGVGRNINYSKAITYYKTYSPSIIEVDKTSLWDKAKKLDEKEIEKNLSEICNRASKLGEAILKIKGFCVYYPKDNSFNFKWNNSTRSEFKQPLEEYNKLVEEFRIYLDSYTSDSDDEKYGYWMYIYEDTLNLFYEICNALVGRDTLYRYLDKVGLPAIDKNKNFEFALGRCLIDDNDKTDNDYIISGLLLIAGHDEDPIWQNKVGLWYEYRNENKDLLQAELWYKKALVLKLSAAQVNIERLKGKKEYKLITDKSEGSSDDRLKIVKNIRGNEELRNKWLLSAALLGNETAVEQLAATIDVKGDCIYNKVCNFEPSWKIIELEITDCKKKIDTWKKIVEKDRKRYIEEEERRIKKEEEARRKAAEEEARRKAAEEEARRRAEEEEERRRQAELDALNRPKSKIWLWTLLALLIAGGAVGYYLTNYSSSEAVEQNVEASDSIRASSVIDENAPTNALAFLNQFYKGKIGEDHIREYVTANVINKLRRDFDYDCPSNDCLATWVFTAYPAGADLDLEKGPIITKTDTEGKFKVDFRYSGYNGSEKTYETRTVYLTVTEMGGKYLICDYEVADGETIEEKEGLLSFEDALSVVEEMEIKDGNFEGFRSPENVNKIMKAYGYERKGKYFVEREILLDLLYYKNCTLAESKGNDCYTGLPSANGGGDASFIGIDGTSLVIAPYSKAAFEGFLKQVKEKGATLVENDESTIDYKYSSIQITGFKRGFLSLNYCITVSKEK